MITKINTNIPSQTNKRIIQTLFTTSYWKHSVDDGTNVNVDMADSGFAMVSYYDNKPHTPHEILNVYAAMILDIVQKNYLIKFKDVQRYYWNWYNPSSKGMSYHKDDLRDNRYSIIYNLHTNDGGTKFKINGKEKFEKSVESEALIFPSKIEHIGVAPKENLHRLNLNIVVKI
tara:strand:+ start:228 stop:746 length:519 start_codon:yes stop_codon:yes gene_type:complete